MVAWLLFGHSMIHLIFLGKFGDVAPGDLGAIALPEGVRSLNELRNWLARREPLLGQAMAATPARLIVNQCVVHDLSQLVADGDEIAFLPPMSGG
jgi:molybdopterin converting factor small subunit